MHAPTSETTTRALVLLDLVDSTQLIQDLGDQRTASLMERHDELARQLLAEHDGLEIDKTDGFLLLFEVPTAALRFSFAYHGMLTELSASEGALLKARAGLHVGEVTLRRSTDEAILRGAKPIEVDGIAKPLAARLMAMAGADQTLLSSEALSAVAASIPAGAKVVCHGHYRVKGIDEPIEVHEIGVEGRSSLAPPKDSAKSYQVVQRAGVWETRASVPNNLPRAITPFLGRARELRQIADRFDHDVALVTLLGPGGTGKSRLARQYGTSWLGSYPSGVWFCDLSSVHSLSEMCTAVASTIGLKLGDVDLPGQVGARLAQLGRTLLIADNFEHMLAHSKVLTTWLSTAPELAILVTSREMLQVHGETVFRVEPLDAPPHNPVNANEASRFTAVNLFVAQARAVSQGFELTDANAADVALITRLVDGLPLAIELAASHSRVMQPKQIVKRLSQRFRLLRSYSRDAAERHTTLRNTIDWSWNLLEPWERGAMQQLAVFRGGFRLEAAEDVLDLSEWPDAPFDSEVIASLVDKSMLRCWDVDGESRFGFLSLVQEYARERLESAAKDDATFLTDLETRHAEHYASLTTQSAVALSYTDSTAWARLMTERQNLGAATERMLKLGAHELAAQLSIGVMEIAQRLGPLSDGLALAERVNVDDVAPQIRVRFHRDFGDTARSAHRLSIANQQLELALDVVRTHGMTAFEQRLLCSVGRVQLEGGNLSGAIENWQLAAQLAAERSDEMNETRARVGLAEVQLNLGQIETARDNLGRALRLGTRLKYATIVCMANMFLGWAHALTGEQEQSRKLFGTALELSERHGLTLLAAKIAAYAGEASLRFGELQQAESWLLQSLEIAERLGVNIVVGRAQSGLSELARRRGDEADAIRWAEAALVHLADGADVLDLGLACARRARLGPREPHASRADELVSAHQPKAPSLLAEILSEL